MHALRCALSLVSLVFGEVFFGGSASLQDYSFALFGKYIVYARACNSNSDVQTSLSFLVLISSPCSIAGHCRYRATHASCREHSPGSRAWLYHEGGPRNGRGPERGAANLPLQEDCKGACTLSTWDDIIMTSSLLSCHYIIMDDIMGHIYMYAHEQSFWRGSQYAPV